MTKCDYKTKTYGELIEQLVEEGLISSYDELKNRAIDEIENDNLVVAIHLLTALNDERSDYYIYDHCMGTLEMPKPISCKTDLKILISE